MAADEENKQQANDDVSREEHKSIPSILSSTAVDTFSLPPLPQPPTSTPPRPAARLLPPLPAAPAVIILRGISGSGKSSIAKHYQSLALASEPAAALSSSSSSSPALPASTRSLVCSADSFFLRNHRYVFDSKLLSQAHSACLASFLALLASHSPYAIVDNTNVQRWEYDNYVRIAELLGYGVLVLEVVVQGEDEVRACGERNVHGVAFSGCQSMADRWEDDSRAVRVRAEWTELDRRRMAQRKEAREQAKLRWQMMQQAREQMKEQQQQQQSSQMAPPLQPPLSVQQGQQSTQPIFHPPPHQHPTHYQPYPQHRPNNGYHPQPYYTHHPQAATPREPAAVAASGEGYRDERYGDGRGRGRGGWRGGGTTRGAVVGRGGYTVRSVVPATAQPSVTPQTAPTHTIRWMAKSATPPAAADNRSATHPPSSTELGASITDASPVVNISLVSAINEPNKRYVIDDTPQ